MTNQSLHRQNLFFYLSTYCRFCVCNIAIIPSAFMVTKSNSLVKSREATDVCSSWQRVISDVGNKYNVSRAAAGMRNRLKALKTKTNIPLSCSEYAVCPVQPISSWPAWRGSAVLSPPSICGESPFGCVAGIGQWSFTILGAKICCKLRSVQFLWLSHKPV